MSFNRAGANRTGGITFRHSGEKKGENKGMKKERLFHLINVCIGVGVLIYGIYGIYSGAYLLVDFLGETGELIKSFYSMTLWYTMLVDYLAYIILGIFRAYPFIRRKTGKYLVNVGCANLLCVLITDVFYHKELGFSMSQMNHRRIILCGRIC